MKAKAKSPHRMIRAFTGREFVSYEWRLVPEGSDDEAERLEAGGYLELKSEPLANVPAVSPEHDLLATEGAVKLAGQLGVSLFDVYGTGQSGRITVPDVRLAASEEEEE